MPTCPHCQTAVDCHGVSGDFTCPHCGGRFLYQPRRMAADGSESPHTIDPVLWQPTLAAPDNEVQRFLDAASPPTPPAAGNQNALDFLQTVASGDSRPTAPRHAERAKRRRWGLSQWGTLALIAGLIGMAGCFCMDTTVPEYPGSTGRFAREHRVYNIGLMERKRSGLILSGVLAVVGAILVGFGAVAKHGDEH